MAIREYWHPSIILFFNWIKRVNNLNLLGKNIKRQSETPIALSRIC